MAIRFIRKNRKAVLHFIELNVRDHRPAFGVDAYARMALQLLRQHCDRHPAKLAAYVMMPTHAHLLINPRDGDAIRFVKDYKAAVTVAYDKLAERLGHQAARAWLTLTSDGARQLWQDGKHDFHVWSDRLIWQKIDYIHNNPIKAGLVKTASDYLYSSFNARYNTGDSIIPIDPDFWWHDLDLADDGF
jgi:REP element-mobilizing transposase RayT